MASRWPDLGPAEVMLLLDPGARPRDALKMALTSLLAKGVLRFGEVEVPGILWTRKRRTLRQVGPAEDATAAERAALTAILAEHAPRMLEDAISVLKQRFGAGFAGFRDALILPDLVRRGLLVRILRRYLLVFARVRHVPSAAGEAERDRLRGLMHRARRLPPFLAENAGEALSVVAGLGTAIFLVEELRPHLPELRALLRPTPADGGGGGDAGSGGDGAPGGHAPDWDLSAFDGADGFGEAFDASAGSGDADGDGGGDSGGDGGGE